MAFEGTDDFTRLTEYREELRPDARRFELISLPFQDFTGMVQSVRLLRELGPASIQAHLVAVRGPVLEWAGRRGIPVTSPGGRAASGIVCVAPPRMEESFKRLRAGRVVCGIREGGIRLSPHCYNTVEEMERVVALLDQGLA
jgi:cysteine desulfurase/selenocysteine lyase